MATTPPKADATPGAPSAPKGKLPVIIALVVASIVAASGGYAWYQSMQGVSAPKPKEAPPPVFVVFDPITVNLQPSGEGDQYLQVGLTARVPTQKDADMMKEYMPQVRSRLLLLLSGQHAPGIDTEEGKRKLVKQMLTTMREPYSEDGPAQRVMNLYFTSFVIQ